MPPTSPPSDGRQPGGSGQAAEAGRRLIVTGRVQGVFYRAWTEQVARGLGLRGWVRNRSDGSVEICVRGELAAIDRLVEACRAGPPAAQVDDVIVSVCDEPVPDDFRKRPTV